MTSPSYSRFHRSIHWLASRPALTALWAKTQHRADRAVLRLSGNRTTLSALVAGVPVVMLTTTGAKSGQPRTAPLLCIRSAARPGQFAVIGTNWGQAKNPGWVYNLRQQPRATALIDGLSGDYLGHEATGDEYTFWWETAVAIYRGYESYQARVGDRHIAIFVLVPAAQSNQ